jgi:hypothetical protein
MQLGERMNHGGGAAVAAVLVTALVCAPSASAQVAFSDQTTTAGLDHTAVLESDMNGIHMFNGGAVGDFNRDGWPDFFLLGGGGTTADALYINNGDGTFTDRAAEWGVAALHRGRGATVGDFNDDGWPDLYVTSSGDLNFGDRPGQHLLYRNDGDGSFTDIALAAGVNEASPTNSTGTSATFGDYDLDGDLDLFVCTWEGYNGNRLFRNNGDETFTDVTGTSGIDYLFWGFSPRFVDMNGDRHPELIIAADFVTSRYFVNDQDGTFTKSTTAGTGLDDNGMGSAIADFNHDGLPDWYVTSIYRDGTSQNGNYLYVNQGNDQYTALPESAGAKNGGWGWGVEAIDFDHDGWTDIVETNGWVEPEFVGETSYLFRNNGDMSFTEVQSGSGFDHTGQGRSLMALDYDRDGDMDVLVTAFEGPVRLFRNDVSGPSTNWIQVRLDTSGEPGLAPEGRGSRVIATTGGVSQYDWMDGGATYLGLSQRVSHFGLGSATTVDITVEWADGTDTVLFGVAANQSITVSPSTVVGAPGETSSQNEPAEQMRAAFNGMTAMIDVVYTPSCDASNHTIYYGDLANIASYGYTGAACWLGSAGTASFDPAGVTNAFFLIVGSTDLVEGSYGSDGSGTERPESIGAASCDLPQDLSGTCGLP